ncbi:MAG: peptide deformylase [Acidimicrobiia bacterium]|nr:peptide deformylase [Actinomycetota bacterium]MBL6924617.1 peptide deformylase [Acidimicrobiia bacterium]MBL6925952.1 peptide deformylase [Acidimicrobiia bacterium]
MAVRPILQIGHPVLRSVARPLTDDEIASPEVQRLIDDMVETMRYANGAGIAANQVGEAVRVIVMEVTDNPRYPYKPQIPLTVAVNPVVESLDDEVFVNNEGCLSVPLRGEVERHVNVRVHYRDPNGDHHDEVARGLTAATWQHECDHLDGVLFVDRVADPTTLSTWEEFEANQSDAFVERITALVDRVGS